MKKIYYAGLICLLPNVMGAIAIAHTSKEGTGLKLEKEKPKTEEILVKARRREQMLVKNGGEVGILGHKKGLDIPFSLKSYTSSMILNQQSQTLGQVLQNDPAVRTTYGYGNFAELFVIRGFPVYGDDVAINGLYGITPRQLVSPQLYDQVQIMTGANAFLNGAAPGGSVGGNINLLFKHAEKEPLFRLTGDYTSGAQSGGSLDVGRRFGEEQKWGARFNIAGMDGETSIHHEYRHSLAIGFDTDYRTEDTRISFDIDYQNQGVEGGRPSLFLSGIDAVPRPVSPSKNYAQKWSYSQLHYVFGMLSLEHDFNKHITFYGAFGGLGGNEKGNYSTLTVSNAKTGQAISGSMYVPYVDTNESLKTGLRIHGDIGSFNHEINLGMSSLWEETDTAWSMGQGTENNLYHNKQFSQPKALWVGGNIANPKKENTERFTSAFFSDTISFWRKRIAITSGFRFQNLLVKDFDYNTRQKSSSYNKDAITPVVGAVVHVTHHASFYFNRIEGLAPGPQASGANVNAGHIFAPYRTVQYEVGAKYDIGRWSANLAFYRMSQPSSYSVPYGNAGQTILVVDGKQRNQGIELGLNGEIIKGLRFNGGSSITQAIQKRTAGGVNNGNRAVGVPSYTINGNLEYDLPFAKGVTMTGRVMRTGRQWQDAGNNLSVKGWTSFDLGARYTFLMTKQHPMTMRFGVENIANHRYWASAYGGYLTEGMPRTFKVSFTTDL